MPSFPITEVPTQISQVVTQESLIQNTGSVTVYLANESTVGSGSYDLIVAAKTTVNWPANASLWAATAAGDTGQLSILYGAKGAGVGDITASIVDPVNVQGGAEVLYDNAEVIASGATTTVTINAPANGLTYYGLNVSASITSSTAQANGQFATVEVNNGIEETEMGLVVNTTATGMRGRVGVTWRQVVNMPFNSTYPLTIDLTNHSSNSMTITLRVLGTSYAFPFAVDDTPTSLQFPLSVGIASAAVNDYITLAPCISDRRYRMAIGAISAGALNTARVDTGFLGTWQTQQENVQISAQYVSAAPPAMPANSVVEFTVPGTGQPARVIFLSAFTAPIRISLLETKRT